MGQARDKAGNIWETDAEGNAVRLLQPAPSAAGRVISLPPSPEKVREQQRQDAADARAERADARAAAKAEADLNPEGTLDPQTVTYYAQQVLSGAPMPSLGMGKQAAAARQAVMREVAKLAGASGRTGEDLARQIAHYKAGSKQLGTLETMLGTIRQNEQTALLNGQQFIDRSSELPGQTRFPLVNSVVQGFERATGNDTIAAHDAAWNTFVNEYAKVVSGSPSGAGTMSDSARHEAMDTMRGNYSLDQKKAAFEQMKRDMENRITAIHQGINEGYRHLTQTPGYEVPETTTALSVAKQRADNEVPGQVTGGLDKPPPGAAPPPDLPPANMPGGNDPTPITPASGGGMQTIAHPEINSMVQSMLAAGAGYSTINAALKQKNASPISFTDYNRAKAFMADPRNKGQAYPVDATEQRPLSMLERAAGSTGGAFAANMANSFTAGIPEYLAGDEGKGSLAAMDALHPTASLAGSVVGGVAGAGAGEAALAARAPIALAKYAPRIADSLYGGISGFTGAEDGSRLEGALGGAILAPIASKVGEKVVRGVGSVAKGVTNPAVQYLRGLNIPLTAGQAAGGFVKKLEDAATSLPGVGNMIAARRNEGLSAFNKAAFDVGAETTGNQVENYGSAGLRDLQDLVGQSYSRALDPVTIDANSPQFVGDLAKTINAAKAIPNVNGAQDAALAALQARIGGAVDPTTETLSGRGFQEGYRGLARTGRERANGDYGHEVGQVMRQGQDALAGALEDQNPGAYQGFLNANAANRRMNILADALGTAKNQEGGMFTPAQLNAADFRNSSKLTGKVAAATGDRPFAELASAGQEVLPSKLPNSGTADRLWTGALLGGAAGGGYLADGTTGAETGLGATLALMAGGTRPGQRALVKLMTDRPDLARVIGESLQREARIGGWTGAGVLTPLVVGQ